MFKSHTILNFVCETLWYSPLFAFQEYIIADKEIKMLELEDLFMLMNILCYTSLVQDFWKMGKALQ